MCFLIRLVVVIRFDDSCEYCIRLNAAFLVLGYFVHKTAISIT